MSGTERKSYAPVFAIRAAPRRRGLRARQRKRGATRYTIDDVVRLAQAQNPEIAIARKKIQAARGGEIEARSGYLPSVCLQRTLSAARTRGAFSSKTR